MAVGNIKRIIPGRNQKGMGSHISDVQPKTAAIVDRGDLLEHNGSGYLVAHGSPIAASEQVVGIAAEDQVASQTIAPVVRFYTANQEFEGTLQDGGATYTLAQATAGYAHVYLAKDGDIWYLDLQDPGSGLLCARITGFRDAIGTVDPRVYFLFDTDVVFPAT